MSGILSGLTAALVDSTEPASKITIVCTFLTNGEQQLFMHQLLKQYLITEATLGNIPLWDALTDIKEKITKSEGKTGRSDAAINRIQYISEKLQEMRIKCGVQTFPTYANHGPRGK